MTELSKYCRSESAEVKRSEISFADYNPRKIGDEERATLKRGIRRFGLVGGIIVNKRTGMTIVGGHQRISVMDELNKYNPETHEGDYSLRVDIVDIDTKEEKELNILLNNPNAQGSWDIDALSRLIPEIDYKVAGLTDVDLSIIGVDYMVATPGESDISDALVDLYAPIAKQNEFERKERKAERKEARLRYQEDDGQECDECIYDTDDDGSLDTSEHIKHIKEIKAEVKDRAQEKAVNMHAYVTISFETFEAKAAFCKRFGYEAEEKFIKGELFDEQVERIDLDE